MITRSDTISRLLSILLGFGKFVPVEVFGKQAFPGRWDEYPLRRRPGQQPGGRMKSVSFALATQLRGLIEWSSDRRQIRISDAGLQWLARYRQQQGCRPRPGAFSAPPGHFFVLHTGPEGEWK